MKIGIHYFSGCGHSRWVALKAQKKMSEAGHTVLFCQSIEEKTKIDSTSTDAELFVFPVYFFGLPANVLAYLKMLPIVASKPAFLWTADGGMSGLARRLGCFWLKDRGYEVVSTREIVMPDSFLGLKSSQITPEQQSAVLSQADEKIAEYLKDFDAPPSKLPLESRFFSYLCGIIYFAYLYCLKGALSHCFVSTSKCTKCNQCIKKCPMHCLRMKDGVVKWGNGCIGCFRCINCCPTCAIDFSGVGLLFGITGGLCGFFLLRFVPFSGWLFSLIGLLVGFYMGTLLFQKIYHRFPENGLLFKNKKRIVADFSEKDL